MASILAGQPLTSSSTQVGLPQARLHGGYRPPNMATTTVRTSMPSMPLPQPSQTQASGGSGPINPFVKLLASTGGTTSQPVHSSTSGIARHRASSVVTQMPFNAMPWQASSLQDKSGLAASVPGLVPLRPPRAVSTFGSIPVSYKKVSLTSIIIFYCTYC